MNMKLRSHQHNMKQIKLLTTEGNNFVFFRHWTIYNKQTNKQIRSKNTTPIHFFYDWHPI